jgi:hypothetical protein
MSSAETTGTFRLPIPGTSPKTLLGLSENPLPKIRTNPALGVVSPPFELNFDAGGNPPDLEPVERDGGVPI